MTKEKARFTFCPIYNGYCKANACMAWQFDITDEIDIDRTNLYASDEEIMTGHYNNPIFKLSTTEGWCKLIDKDL